MKGDVFVEMAKVTSKGQITIPVSIRRKLGIKEGDKLLFIDSADGVVMVNPDRLQKGHTAAKPDAEVMESDFDDMSAMDIPLEQAAVSKNPLRSASPDRSEKPAFSASSARPAAEKPPSPYSPPLSAPPPPVPEVPVEPAKPAAAPSPQVKGVDIGALLDEIRSIGSKI